MAEHHCHLIDVMTTGGMSNGVRFCHNGDRNQCLYDETGKVGLLQSGNPSGNLKLQNGVRANGRLKLSALGQGHKLLSRVHHQLQ